MSRRRLAVLVTMLTGLAFVFLGVGPASATGTIRWIPASVPADCSVDVTAQLQSFLDNTVQDGDKMQFPASACYRVDGTLQVVDRNNIIFAGNGSTIKMVVTPPELPKVGHDIWQVVGGTGLRFQNMTVQSTNPTPDFNQNREWYALFDLKGVDATTLINVHGNGAWGDFVSVGPDQRNQDSSGTGKGAVPSTGVTVQNSTTNVIGRNDVSVTDASGVTVDSNTFTGTGYVVFDVEVEASAWYARNLALTNNTIGGKVSLGVLDNGGIGHDITGVTFSSNTMLTTPSSCISPVNVLDTQAVRTNFAIDNNVLRTITVPLNVNGVGGLHMTGNSVANWGGGCSTVIPAISGTNNTAVTITGNDFTGTTKLFKFNSSFIGTKCGNRLTGTGFDQPVAC